MNTNINVSTQKDNGKNYTEVRTFVYSVSSKLDQS